MTFGNIYIYIHTYYGQFRVKWHPTIHIMGPTVLFGTIHESHCTISTNIYFYLQYFQQKVFSFSKISESQIDSWYMTFHKNQIERTTIYYGNIIMCVCDQRLINHTQSNQKRKLL